jgi:hypothetical protein
LVSVRKKTTAMTDLDVRKRSDCVSSLGEEEHKVLTLAWEEEGVSTRN